MWIHHLYQKITFNTHANVDPPWCYPVKRALTVDCISRGHHTANEVDSSGLGKWTWIRLEGHLNTFVSYIAAYQPCRNVKDEASTCNQYVRYFSEKGTTSPNPRDNFDDDLIALLCIILRNRDNTILGIDMNKDVRTGKLAKRLKELGLLIWYYLPIHQSHLRQHSTEILLKPRSMQSGVTHH